MKQSKKMIQKVIFPFFSLFLLFQSYKLLKIVWFTSNFSLFTQFLLAILVNLFVTGIFAFIGFAYSTHLLIGKNYYKIKNATQLKKLASFLKLKYFTLFLLFIFWGKQKNRKKYFDGTKEGLTNFEFQTKQSEFGHLISFIFIMLAAVLMLIKQQYIMAFTTTIINVIFNFYPILLQRMHRIRIERLKLLMHKKVFTDNNL